MISVATSIPATSDENACDRIAWTGNNGTEIYVADADGEDRIEISQVAASPPLTANSPAWSADGLQIAFIGIRDLVTRLWLVDADGTDQLILSEVDAGTDPTANGGPHFGPAGDLIVWSGNDGATSQIWIADTDGTDRDEIFVWS